MMAKFEPVGLVFMAVALWIGNMLGPILGSSFGIGSGLIGSLLSGAVVYVIYSLISGTKMTLWGGVTFSVSVWMSVMITGIVMGYIPLLSMWVLMLFVQAIILSIIWSFIAPKQQTTEVPVQI